MAGFTLSSDPLSALWPGKDTDFRDALSFKKSSKFFLNFQCVLPSLYCDSFQVIPKDPPSSVTPSFLSLAQSPRGQSTLKVDKDKNSLFLFPHLPVNPNPDKPKALIVWPLSHSPDASTVTLCFINTCVSWMQLQVCLRPCRLIHRSSNLSLRKPCVPGRFITPSDVGGTGRGEWESELRL